MLIKLKNTETKIATAGVLEQKLFRQGVAVGWLLSLSLIDDIPTEELDSLLSTENIDEISLYKGDEENTDPTYKFTGYEKVTSCIIKYTESKNTTEIQLTKGV